MSTSYDLSQFHGATVIGRDGEKIGKIKDVYEPDGTNSSWYASVSTGLFGTKHSFVPLDGSAWADNGDLTVAYTKDEITKAPQIDEGEEYADTHHEQIGGYYGGTATATAATAPTATAPPKATTDTDGTLTLSEERLHAGTEQVETGRARLRKVVVTEQKSITVPVRREEVRLVREPIEGGVTGGTLTEGEIDVTLHEERPVVAKETVATERVRLDTTQVTEEKTVTAEVGHEELKTEGVDVRGARADLEK